MDTNYTTSDLSIRVLGKKVDDGFAAVAVDMDLWGFGPTAEASLDDLVASVRIQVSFALQMEDVHLLERSAPQKVIDQFNECRFARLRREKMADFFVKSLPYPTVDTDLFIPI